MNKRTACLIVLLVLAGAVDLQRTDSTSRRERKVPNQKIASPTIAGQTISSHAAAPSTATPPPSPALQPARTWMFGEITTKGELVQRTTHDFKPSTWELDVRQACELPATVPLQRRTGWFRMGDGFPVAKVRVDRVYRMDRSALTTSSDARSSTSSLSSPATLPDPLDAEGGELLWENAMVADQLLVQTKRGVTVAALRRVLPADCRLRDKVTSDGLFAVVVQADGERGIENAILAITKLPGIEFAEPDHLIKGADTSPNDPLVGSNTDTQQWHLGKIMAPRAWSLINAPKSNVDAAKTVIAIVDTGMDYTHPDLAANLWTNPGESGGGYETNGHDDDGNGKIDDVHGWDFIGQSAVQTTIQPDNNPMDDVGHGTHVAGIAGAVGNNALGGTGVCWGVKLLPLRIIKKWGTGTYGTYSTAIGALSYIKDLNTPVRQVAVANHSWGGTGYSLAMLNAVNNPIASSDPLPAGLTCKLTRDANELTVNGSATELAKIKPGMTISSASGIPNSTLVTIVTMNNSVQPPVAQVQISAYTTKATTTNTALTFSNPVRAKPYGVVHVAAAGNSRLNNDRFPMYPASIPSTFVISVGASDSTDHVSLWEGTTGSNTGAGTVDLFAPGTHIWSTKLKLASESGYGYEMRNGTSMAAPQVAGAVALLRLWQPALTELQTRQITLDSVDKVDAFKDKCATGGRLNVAAMLDKVFQGILLGSGGSTIGTTTQTAPLQGAAALSGRLAIGGGHALAIADGKVFGWGRNGNGQLADPSRQEYFSTPREIPGIDGVVMVAAGNYSSLALRYDGTVWVWGANFDGQFGNGLIETNFNAPVLTTPTQIAALSDIVWLSVSSTDCLAVKADGTVWAWGRNATGALGDGTTTGRYTPFQVAGLSGIVQASVGNYTAAAVSSAGSLFVWGQRDVQSFVWNSLGDGDPATSTLPEALTPHQLTGLSNIVQAGMGDYYGMALAQDGSVWQWGAFDQSDPLSSLDGSMTPVARGDVSGIIAIAAGPRTFFAQNGDGNVFAWGNGELGKLGNGADLSSELAVAVVAPENDAIASVAAGRYASMAVSAEGKLLAWGVAGFLGNGKNAISGSRYPVRLPAGSSFMDIGVGPQLCYAIASDGSLLKWGIEGYQQDNEHSIQRPTAMEGFGNVAKMIVGARNESYMIKNDGSVWSWGVNAAGQLGLGDLVDRTQPTLIAGLSGVQDIAAMKHQLYDVDQNALNYAPYYRTHVLALKGDGTVVAWGGNEHGQLGDTSTTDRLAPVSVSGLTGVSALAAGMGHSLALKADGTVWAWGHNHYGQLGNNSTADSPVPLQVAGLNGVVKIGARGYYSFAVKADGSVYAWGFAEKPGFTIIMSEKHTPQLVTNLPAVLDVASGEYVMTALLPDHTVLAWGDDNSDNSRLARDTTSSLPNSTPAPVVGLTDVVTIDCPRYAYALKSDGSLWGWGFADNGTFGDNAAWANLPSYVIGFGALSADQSNLGTASVTDSWLFHYFSAAELTNPLVSGDIADPDGDGIPNLIEYALGLDPLIGNNTSALPLARVDVIAGDVQNHSASPSAGGVQLFGTPSVDLSGGKHYLALTVSRQQDIRSDLDYMVEVSDDLVQWHSGDPYTVTVLDNADTLEVYSTTSLDDAPRQFMRLKVQRK